MAKPPCLCPAKETVGRQGLRLCRVPRLAVAAPRRSFPTKSIAAKQPSLSAPQQDRAPVLRLKDARRIATRDEKCANNFLSAVCLVALISFWLNSVWNLVSSRLFVWLVPGALQAAQVIDWLPQETPKITPRIEGDRSTSPLGLCLAIILAAWIYWRATRGRVLLPSR